MSPDTKALLERSDTEEDIMEKIARAAMRAAERQAPIPTQSLPVDVTLFTMTMDELHDLIYNSASPVLREHGLNITKSQRAAIHIANRAMLLVNASDYRHVGPDPRG